MGCQRGAPHVPTSRPQAAINTKCANASGCRSAKAKAPTLDGVTKESVHAVAASAACWVLSTSDRVLMHHRRAHGRSHEDVRSPVVCRALAAARQRHHVTQRGEHSRLCKVKADSIKSALADSIQRVAARKK